MACLSFRSNLVLNSAPFCFFPPVGQHDPPRGRELPAVLPQRSSPEKQRRLHEGELRVRRRGAARASFRMSIVEVSGTNKENPSGTYLSVKHPESDKTDDYTVGWISGYLGYRISEVMLRWSHQGRAPEETCVWLASLAWTAKLCFLVTICVFSQSMETQDMRKVHPLYLFAPYFIDGLKSRQTVQGVGPLWHHKHLTDASPRLVMLILFLSASQHGRSSKVSVWLGIFFVWTL